MYYAGAIIPVCSLNLSGLVATSTIIKRGTQAAAIYGYSRMLGKNHVRVTDVKRRAQNRLHFSLHGAQIGGIWIIPVIKIVFQVSM